MHYHTLSYLLPVTCVHVLRLIIISLLIERKHSPLRNINRLPIQIVFVVVFALVGCGIAENSVHPAYVLYATGNYLKGFVNYVWKQGICLLCVHIHI